MASTRHRKGPRLIILIRHAQSEGNKNREIHQTIPDHRVKLTQDGWKQAYDAGRRLRALLRADDTIHFFTSPYRRTRETTEGILATLTSDDPEPSPFKRSHIKVYEEPRLREQDFGNFQPCSAEMERMWQERADYGHFFYRIPNGESAADAYDRISGFNESLWRQFGDDDFASVCVLVTHGLMSRVFLMKWYHFSVEYFEDLRNVNHCEFLIMTKQESGKYVLENKLRTWSELRRERALKEKEKEEKDGGKDGGKPTKDTAKLDKALSAHPPVAPRRWGGCPNGCDHDKAFRVRSALADLVRRDGTSVPPRRDSGGTSVQPSPTTTAVSSTVTNGIVTPTTGTSTPSSSSLCSRRPAARRFQSEDDDSDANATPPQIDVTKARDEVISSPDGTPSFISVDDRLRAALRSPANSESSRPPVLVARGRDFGGTKSGDTSRDGSDEDTSEDEQLRSRLRNTLKIPPADAGGLNANKSPVVSGPDESRRDLSGMGRGAMANRLGDSPVSSECCEHHRHHRHQNHDADDERDREDSTSKESDGLSDDLSDIDEAEREDRSIAGSVY